MGSAPIGSAGQVVTEEAGAIARNRAEQAHELRVAGLHWREIALRTGYIDGKVAAMAVTAYLQKAAIEHGQHARHRALELELERLDNLHAAYWPAALNGDTQAANLILKTSAARSHLLGLEQAQGIIEQPRTIVISGDEAEYVAGLRAIVEGRHPDDVQ